jgi:hypothetical protein
LNADEVVVAEVQVHRRLQGLLDLLAERIGPAGQARTCMQIVGLLRSVQFLRLKTRRGAKKAILAGAASMLGACYHMLCDGVAYRDLGPDHFTRHDKTTPSRASSGGSAISDVRWKSSMRRRAS